MASPTIQRRRLGKALRRAREEARKSQDDAAAAIDAAKSKIVRLEKGHSGLRVTDLNVLLDLYGVTGGDTDWMREMARTGRQRGRWSAYRNVTPDWFVSYLDLEEDASEMRWYQSEVVPGVLQAESYVRAILSTAQPSVADDEVERRVKLRLERRAVLESTDRVLNFILSESALRRNVGGDVVMAEQLRHLAEVAERSNVQLQVLPFTARTFSAATYGFIVLRFDHDTTSDVVYLEDYTDAAYLDQPEHVRAYNSLWNRLSAAALGQVESRDLIRDIADEHQQTTPEVSTDHEHPGTLPRGVEEE
ncbi:MAG: helix-turn-helix domain-containing protein [Actinophytocola sp.]|nr:helix-turn-helix domain-containing protein [Actinophytocola sp.]